MFSHAVHVVGGQCGASTTRMLLLSTLFPCRTADSLRGLGSAVPSNTTRSSTPGACTSAYEAKMTELGSGNADGTSIASEKTRASCIN